MIGLCTHMYVIVFTLVIFNVISMHPEQVICCLFSLCFVMSTDFHSLLPQHISIDYTQCHDQSVIT